MRLGPRSTTPDGNEENAPLWRRHFPVDTEAETSRARREFIGGLTVAGVAMACGQVALNSMSPSRKSPGEESQTIPHTPLVLERKLGELQTGEALLFHYPDEKSPCLLVKLKKNEFVAFAQKCTHLACPVIPDAEKSQFHCPCHHGAFDLKTGKPLSGPPRASLPTIEVELADDGTLTATGIT